ncbi:MAG: peptidylprolyl isomerase [Hyphomonadaceae bacterium]
MAFALGACGLGRGPDQSAPITDPVVAARVNGKPIYIEDVRAYAVLRGYLREGEDLNANSNAFFYALEELIEARLFAEEAESRGLDRDRDIRRRLDAARERVLANAIYEEIAQKASDPREIERLYRENASRLGQGREIHLRHIQFVSRDAALAAKRRLDQGERFEALAFELSTDRATAADGGDLGFQATDDLAEPVRQLVEQTNVGEVAGPVRNEVGWHLFQVVDKRERGVPSLETLRPKIVEWLIFQETQRLRERLEANARIERLREPDSGQEPGGAVQPPAAASQQPGPAESQPSPPPAANASPPPAVAAAPSAPAGAHTPPPFPFPMGPGGVYGGPPSSAALPTPPAQPARPAPAAAPTRQESPSPPPPT